MLKLISIQDAIELLKKGSIVALPTETVYGLAVRYDSKEGIEALYELKGRPKQKPLTINIYEPEEIRRFINSEPEGLDLLIKSYWPGPLTLVLDVKESLILPIVTNGDKTCGFRVPDHELTRAVIKEAGPIVLPSANLSGHMPAVDAEGIRREFHNKVPILDGGVCRIGVASTVLVFLQGQWKILREGAVSAESLRALLGYELQIVSSSQGEN